MADAHPRANADVRTDTHGRSEHYADHYGDTHANATYIAPPNPRPTRRQQWQGKVTLAIPLEQSEGVSLLPIQSPAPAVLSSGVDSTGLQYATPDRDLRSC